MVARLVCPDLTVRISIYAIDLCARREAFNTLLSKLEAVFLSNA